MVGGFPILKLVGGGGGIEDSTNLDLWSSLKVIISSSLSLFSSIGVSDSVELRMLRSVGFSTS